MKDKRYSVPEWEFTRDDNIDYVSNFFDQFNEIKFHYSKYYCRHFKSYKNREKKLYISMLVDLEMARNFIQVIEESLDETSPDWLQKSNKVAGLRYALGFVQTFFEEIMYADRKFEMKKKPRKQIT